VQEFGIVENLYKGLSIRLWRFDGLAPAQREVKRPSGACTIALEERHGQRGPG